MVTMYEKAELVLRLQKFIEGNKGYGEMVAFYLFGSYATGRQTPKSDIDLAVLLDKAVGKEQYLDERLGLMGKLSVVLGNVAFDVVVLNEVPASLAYRVIRDGELLYIRDEAKKQLVDFKVRTMDQYFDFRPAQKIFSEGLARRIKEGGFGGR